MRENVSNVKEEKDQTTRPCHDSPSVSSVFKTTKIYGLLWRSRVGALCALKSFLTRMREHMFLEIATLLAGIVALCTITFESFVTGMREDVLLEIASLFTKIVALSAFEGILP